LAQSTIAAVALQEFVLGRGAARLGDIAPIIELFLADVGALKFGFGALLVTFGLLFESSGIETEKNASIWRHDFQKL